MSVPMNKTALRNIILIWLGWVIIVIGFQALATARLKPQFPDRAQEWTETETGARYQKGHPFLLDPFMNNQVAWDSEYYLGIAVGGYDEPRVTHLSPGGGRVYDSVQQIPKGGEPKDYLSLSYAFFPFYPWMIWLFSQLIKFFGMNPIATATFSGVLVSALGTLGGMIAIYDLARRHLDENGALRAAFFLIIFPTGFFLLQVYTEGLFVGLAFGCLALVKRGKWVPAALLGAAATLTRAVGVALVIPMAILWIRTGEWTELDLEWRQFFLQGIPWRSFGKALLVFLPLVVFIIWKFSYLGVAFDYVESNFFGRGVLNLGQAFYAWSEAFKVFFQRIPERGAYFSTELIGLLIGVITCVACLRKDPEIAWFSLAVLIISWGSGQTQGIQRYVIGAPAVFIMLAIWGKNSVFEKIWTIFSILLMGLLAMLYAFNFWVA
jgi:hypothetical protein